MGAFIPLLLALASVEFFRGQKPTDATTLTMILLAAAGPLGVLVLGEIAARLLARWGSRRSLRRYELAATAVLVGWFAVLCGPLGWASVSQVYSISLLPWIGMQLALWWTLTPAWRQVSGFGWSRSAFVLHHLRFELAPILVAAPVLDVCEWLARVWGTNVWFQGSTGVLMSGIGALLLMAGLIAFLPGILAALWGARRLPPGPLAERLAADCAAAGVPDAHLRMWLSPGGRVHNAVAMGVLPRLRYVMFSDDLVRDLPPQQVRAVLGHELGHVRHGHLWLYLLFAATTFFASWSILSELLGTSDANGRLLPIPFGFDGSARIGLLFLIPGVDHLPSAAVAWTTMALMGLAVWRWLFGHLSRACERQADLAGAAAVGDARIMAEALRAVARLSGTPEKAPSWRHHSIHDRAVYLDHVAADPALAQHHHRIVSSMRLQLVLILVLMSLLAAAAWLNPLNRANTADPAAELSAMTGADRELGDSLVAADRGDTGPLIRWLTRADAVDRQRVGRLVLRHAVEGPGRQHHDRILWHLRHRLTALSTVSTGSPLLDIDIDNGLAYGLVAGTRDPEPRDIELARAILPRLERHLAQEHSHSIQDTVGCVLFAHRDYAGAVRAFELALTQLAEDRLPQAQRSDAEALYRRRLEAAQTNAAIAANRQPPPFVPLPLDFDPDQPELP